MNGFDRVLQILLVVAPSVIIGGWGNSIFEPKLLALLLGAAVFSGFLMRGTLPGRASQIPLFGKGLLGLIVAQVIGLAVSPNLGAGLAALGLTVSWWIVFVCVFQFGFSGERLCVAGLVLASLCLVATVPDILFGVSLISPYAPRGGLIGVRNALVVFLAQLIPLLLLFFADNRQLGRRNISANVVAFIILTLSLYVICLSRVRSAWVMLIVYCVGLGLAQFRRGPNYSRLVLRDLMGAGVCAATLAGVAPTTLRWSDSASPYLSSLASLFSLEASHGRDLLWRVALEMIALAPWLGSGTGSYASQWPQFISQAGVAPGGFAFLRLDLPLFNDYLQCAVENGVVAGMVFTGLFLGVPLAVLLKQLIFDKNIASSTYLLTLICVATSVDAMVDYPFHRVETSLFFIVALSLVARQVWPLHPAVRGRVLGGVSAVCGVYALCLALVMASAFWLRTSGWGARGTWSLKLSFRLWPFDTYYSSETIASLSVAQELDLAQRLVRARRSYWPSDPEGFLMLARLLEHQGAYDGAEAAYGRARFFVEEGRCYSPGIKGYRDFLARHRPDRHPLDPHEEQAMCLQRRMER